MGQGVMTEFELDQSDYEGVLNVVRTAGEARDPAGFSRSLFANSPSSSPQNGLCSTRSISRAGNY